MVRRVFALVASLVVLTAGVCGPVHAVIVTVQLENYPKVVRVYDMNGDGHLDIVIGADDVDNTGNWVLTVLRGYGNTSGHVGEFHPAQTKDLNLDNENYVLSDLELGQAGGDTYPDAFFLLQNPPFDKLYRIFGNNDGTFGAKTSWNTNDDAVSLNVFNRDGDAYADVAYVTSVGSGADTLGLRCGNSTGGFGNEQTGDGNSPEFLRIADVVGPCGGPVFPSCPGPGRGAVPDGAVDYVMVMLSSLSVQAVSCRTTVNRSNSPLVLDADVDCRNANLSADSFGIRVLAGKTLDCNGYRIYGPDDDGTGTTRPTPHTTTNRVGVLVKGSGVTVKNCKIHGFETGLRVEGRFAYIYNNELYTNSNYGAWQKDAIAFGVKWDRNTFHDNGDEGIHIANQYNWKTNKCAGATAKVAAGFYRYTLFTNNAAYNNGREGYYLLDACNIHLGDPNTADAGPSRGNSSSNNGQLHSSDDAGVYVKHSPSASNFTHRNIVQYMRLTNDHFRAIGKSDWNLFSDITIIGSFVKLDDFDNGPEKKPIGITFPNNNLFSNVCVQNASASVDNGFIFKGVAAPLSTGNTVVGGEVRMPSTSGHKAVSSQASSIGGAPSSNNTIGTLTNPPTTKLFVSPASLSCENLGGASSNCNLRSDNPPTTCY